MRGKLRKGNCPGPGRERCGLHDQIHDLVQKGRFQSRKAEERDEDRKPKSGAAEPDKPAVDSDGAA